MGTHMENEGNGKEIKRCPTEGVCTSRKRKWGRGYKRIIISRIRNGKKKRVRWYE